MNIYLGEIAALDDSDQDSRLFQLGNLGDFVWQTSAVEPPLTEALQFVVDWLVQPARTWDDREAALGVLLDALEYDLLAGVDLEPVEKLQPSLDDELKRYVDDLFERGPPPSK